MVENVEIVFEHVEPSDALRERVNEEMEKLSRLNGHIASSRVVISRPHHHHHKGNPFEVRIMLKIPGQKDVIVNHEPADNDSHDDPYIALRDAFRAASRQLRDKSARH